MLQLSFYDINKCIIKYDNLYFQSLSLDTSNVITKVINNKYLIENFNLIKQPCFVDLLDCKLSYLTNKKNIIKVQGWSFHCSKRDINFIKTNKTLHKVYLCQEIYVPGLLKNGRGLWFIRCGSSILSEFDYLKNKYVSKELNTDGNIKLNV